jgi:hypothetical protein
MIIVMRVSRCLLEKRYNQGKREIEKEVEIRVRDRASKAGQRAHLTSQRRKEATGVNGCAHDDDEIISTSNHVTAV